MLIVELSDRLGAALKRAGYTVTTAESCTGGLLAAALTEVPGSSAWFEQGYVTYSNAAKSALLGVSANMIDSEGAVSEPVVRAMAEGALQRSGANLAIAVSGVAGPGGGSDAKPVGTVWIAWSMRSAEKGAEKGAGTHAACLRFDGDRQSVRTAAVAEALLVAGRRVASAVAGSSGVSSGHSSGFEEHS